MRFGELVRAAGEFRDRLAQVKAMTEPPSVGWYPPMLPGHIETLDELLVGEHRRLLEEPSGKPVADVGAADGDLGFFLESVGFDVDLFDGANRPQLLHRALGSSAGLHHVNLDRDFELPRRYELVFFLHVLYHLRNPMAALGTLARWSQYCVLSTRVSNRLGRGVLGRRARFHDLPVAYLLDAGELNPNDPFNYWIFTTAGLRRVLDRTGWEVLHHVSVGNAEAGPADIDQLKVWCLLRSREFSWA